MSPAAPTERSPATAAARTAESPAVALAGVTKRFGALVANRDVHLSVRAQTVHAIVGENGAGKSTLMKVLAGVLPADAGTVLIDGAHVNGPGAKWDARAAIRHGIGMVHQHFMLVEPLTVAENLVLGEEPRRAGRRGVWSRVSGAVWGLAGGLVDRDAAAAAVRELGQTFGLPLDPAARIADLTVGERQRVEILKVLDRGARVLVLDEPTAVLTPAEVGGLFAMLRRFVAQGRTVILITHKLDEVMAIADRVTVMRRGETVAEVAAADTDARDLAHRMVGRDVDVGRRERGQAPPDGVAPVLRVRDLVVGAGAVPAVAGVSLDVRPGEILGIAGVQGNGQSELLDAIAGLRSARGGSVWVGDRDITRATPRERFAAGLAHIPEDRQQRGLVLDFSVAENLVLGRHRDFRRWYGLDEGRIDAEAESLVARFDVRPPEAQATAGTLSGGNQQKVVVAREMARAPRVLLAGQPTRGVDVGAIESIHGHVRAARDAGLGVLLVSADLGELLALSDRVAVLVRGRVVAELPAAEATPEILGEKMLGASPAGGAA